MFSVELLDFITTLNSQSPLWLERHNVSAGMCQTFYASNFTCFLTFKIDIGRNIPQLSDTVNMCCRAMCCKLAI